MKLAVKNIKDHFPCSVRNSEKVSLVWLDFKGGVEGGGEVLILYSHSFFTKILPPTKLFFTIVNPVLLSQKNTLKSLISTEHNKCKV